MKRCLWREEEQLQGSSSSPLKRSQFVKRQNRWREMTDKYRCAILRHLCHMQIIIIFSPIMLVYFPILMHRKSRQPLFSSSSQIDPFDSESLKCYGLILRRLRRSAVINICRPVSSNFRWFSRASVLTFKELFPGEPPTPATPCSSQNCESRINY